MLLDERIAIAHPRDVFTLRDTPQFTAHMRSLWAVLGQQFRNAA
ncbi:ABC transporter ATP-binding protein [Bordetella pertussis]|nr:ABC transporter ATP-binding protein [Bordetella pertussis]